MKNSLFVTVQMLSVLYPCKTTTLAIEAAFEWGTPERLGQADKVLTRVFHRFSALTPHEVTNVPVPQDPPSVNKIAMSCTLGWGRCVHFCLKQKCFESH